MQALRNGLNKRLNANNGKFEVILGKGIREEVAAMIRTQFHIDGRNPSGRKVGLLDRHQLMCYLVDPFCYEWRYTFLLGTNQAELVKEMIEKNPPLDDDGKRTSRDRVTKDFKVSILLTHFISYHINVCAAHN